MADVTAPDLVAEFLTHLEKERDVSPNTVKTQCAAIYRKLAVSSRQAAVHAAREHHLL